MKKIAILLVFLSLTWVISAQQSSDQSLSLRAGVGAIVGSEDYARGATVLLHAQYNLFDLGLYAGIYTNINYDLWYANFSMPIMSTLGLGKDFYFMVGSTIDITPATNPTTLTTATTSGFPNTYGIGYTLPYLPLNENGTLQLVLVGEILYTEYSSESSGSDLADAFGSLFGFLANIKATAAVSLEALPF